MAGTGMTKSGFCEWPSSIEDSHKFCKRDDCTCDCHLTSTPEEATVADTQEPKPEEQATEEKETATE